MESPPYSPVEHPHPAKKLSNITKTIILSGIQTKTNKNENLVINFE